MGHKDGHPLPHGAGSPAHHWGGPNITEHHSPHMGDGDMLGNGHCEHPDANVDCLWVDIGGEG